MALTEEPVSTILIRHRGISKAYSAELAEVILDNVKRVLISDNNSLIRNLVFQDYAGKPHNFVIMQVS